MRICPSIHDHEVLALCMAEVVESLLKSVHEVVFKGGRGWAQIPDAGYSRLPRHGGKRRRQRPQHEPAEESAPVHLGTMASSIRRMRTSLEDGSRESSRRLPANAVTFVTVCACASATLGPVQ